MVGEPPRKILLEILEILQGAGKDGGGCDGGRQGYGNRARGCVDPGRDGDVELHMGGYWDAGLCTGVCGSGGVGSSVGVGGTDGVGSGCGGGVGSGDGESDSGGSTGGS